MGRQFMRKTTLAHCIAAPFPVDPFHTFTRQTCINILNWHEEAMFQRAADKLEQSLIKWKKRKNIQGQQ